MKNSTRKYTSHIPCPCGKSSDAFSLNEWGGGQCFSCGKKYSPYELENKEEKNMLKKEDIVEEFFEFKPHRGITVDTFKRFGVSTRVVKTRDRPDGFDYEVGFPYPNGAVKIRNMEKKSFHTSGPIRDAGCFGIDKFDPNAYGTIMIVEGEFDALAASQMLDPMCAVVSVQSSSSARRDCTKDWHKINQFDKIIFALDSDEPGQKATTEIASLFDFNKTFKMDMTKYKDPNDYLINGDYVDFVRLFKQVKRFTPDNVISAFDDIAKSLEESDEDQIGTYPFTGLQEMLYGLHKGEVVVFKGEPGIGKTEIFRAIEHHLLKTEENCRLGLIHLEEDEGTTVRAIATYEDNYPHVHPQHKTSVDDVMKAYKSAVKEQDNKIFIYESFDMEDENKLIDTIRFLVSACGCNFIFLDHITWIGTGLEGEDERKKLDRVSQRLKLLAKELRFCLCMISHTNDDGKTRGSRNIANVANTIINLKRDKEHANEHTRRTTFFSIEKARAGGNTGPAGYAIFDKEVMQLKDVEKDAEFVY